MSAENVDVVRRAQEAYVRGDVEAATELLAPDFEMEHLPQHPEAGTYRSAEAADASMTAWRESFEEFETEVEDLVDLGDKVMVAIRERGRIRGSQAEVDHLFAMLFTLREGKITRLEWFDSPEDALGAAGAE